MNDQDCALGGGQKETLAIVAKEVITGISYNVHKKYDIIDLQKAPDHVNYSRVEKYLRSVGVEITRKMFFTYLKENLLPGGHEVKNTNFSYYTKEQIIYYILIDMFKPILPLSKVKILFSDMLRPMIADMGLEAAYQALREMTDYMVSRFEDAVTRAVAEEALSIKQAAVPEGRDDSPQGVKHRIAHYTNLVTLCMAKGALDFYKHSPDTLLE
jgi:Domain of unknown function (DUF1836).